MKKVLKDLKPFRFLIVLVIALLFVQAMADLSLPDYMSNIVNVGIQQKGIEDFIPEAMREEELEKIKLFVKEDNINIIEDSYELIKSEDSVSDSKILDKYPYLKDNNIYLLKELDESYKLELKEVMLNPILTNMFLSDEGMQELDGLDIELPEGVDIYTAMANMPEEMKDEMIDNIDVEISKLPEMYLKQGALRFTSIEYETLGMNLDQMQMNYIIKIGIKMLLLSLLIMATAISVVVLANRIGAGFSKNLRDSVFKKIMEFSNEEFNDFSTASLITRSTNDIQQIQQLTIMVLRIVFFAPIMGIGGVIKALNTNVSMAWIVGLGVICIFIFVGVLFILVTPKFKKSQKIVDRLNLVTRESLTGMLVVRAFNNEEFEENKFKVVNEELTKTQLSISRYIVGMMPGMQLLLNAMMLLIMWVGANQIEQSAIQVGDMMAFMQYAMQIIMSFLMISVVSIILPRAVVSINRVSEILNKEVKIKDSENPVKKLDKKGLVEFKNVGFKYPDAEDNVLSDISFTAKPGETTAFIGSTGSGKSTLINLIPRLFDVTEGSIILDGVNIKDMKLDDLREGIGYVPQKGVLFTGDIESNIKYGKNRDISMDQVNMAIDTSQSREFINNYEQGLKNPITQGGSNVSGGQRQRLSIARAIASNPDVLIFDDSFSALDFKTDKLVRRAIKENLGESTMLIVAQRISTIKDAENIVVLDEGSIVGQGTHKELLKSCEVYNQIAKSQLSEEELNYE